MTIRLPDTGRPRVSPTEPDEKARLAEFGVWLKARRKKAPNKLSQTDAGEMVQKQGVWVSGEGPKPHTARRNWCSLENGEGKIELDDRTLLAVLGAIGGANEGMTGSPIEEACKILNREVPAGATTGPQGASADPAQGDAPEQITDEMKHDPLRYAGGGYYELVDGTKIGEYVDTTWKNIKYSGLDLGTWKSMLSLFISMIEVARSLPEKAGDDLNRKLDFLFETWNELDYDLLPEDMLEAFKHLVRTAEFVERLGAGE